MFTIREYAMPETLDEAYTILKSRKGNQILGGCAWLRLGKKRINIAVDLTKCGLDYIREDDEQIEIGAMTSYRSVETSDILKKYFNGVIADSVSSIIGTQFRNTVTVGGSVSGTAGEASGVADSTGVAQAPPGPAAAPPAARHRAIRTARHRAEKRFIKGTPLVSSPLERGKRSLCSLCLDQLDRAKVRSTPST